MHSRRSYGYQPEVRGCCCIRVLHSRLHVFDGYRMWPWRNVLEEDRWNAYAPAQPGDMCLLELATMREVRKVLTPNAR